MAGLPLVELALNDNKIRFLENLGDLVTLQRLSVAQNRIASLAGLETCVQLGTLDASDNAVAAVREVEHLRGLPLFSVLWLRGNPCADLDFCRRRVIVRLQRLTSLDDDDVTSEEKIKSINIHGGDESDVGHRKEMYLCRSFVFDAPLSRCFLTGAHLGASSRRWSEIEIARLRVRLDVDGRRYKKYFGSDAAWENTLPPFVETEPSPLVEAAAKSRVIDALVHRAFVDSTFEAENKCPPPPAE